MKISVDYYQGRKMALTKLLKNTKDEEGVRWNIKFRVRPGHLEWVRNHTDLKEKFSKIEPLLGQNDLLLTPDLASEKSSSFFRVF